MSKTLQQHDIEPQPTSEPCSACAQAKFVHKKGKGHLVQEATAFLDVIHIDLVGGRDVLPPSISINDVAAATLAIVAIDEFTRFKWVIPIYSKKDCPKGTKLFLQHLNSEFGKYPRRLHSDRGSEFLVLSEFLRERGIRPTDSAAYAHEQNGLVERTVRTIFEALRATHIAANIPSKV